MEATPLQPSALPPRRLTEEDHLQPETRLCHGPLGRLKVKMVGTAYGPLLIDENISYAGYIYGS